MITDTFLIILNYILDLFVQLFPVGNGFPEAVHNGAVTIGGYARTLDPVLPFDTLATVIVLLITVEIVVFSFRGFKWLVSHLPFIGGRG